MKVNQSGLDLIQKFEGFRGRAYRDAVGVWTIGFGHTSRAGAPTVKAGMVVSRDRGLQILAKDVALFADGVAALVTSELNDNQFSALVSFAYNVGLGAFRSSGVLKAVNAGDFDNVARRLALWTKAGGRVLPGLVRRRAAEAELFATQVNDTVGDILKPVVEALPGKPLLKSKTAWSAGLAGVLAAVQGFWAAHQQLIVWGLAVVIIAAALLVIYERHKKSKWEGL